MGSSVKASLSDICIELEGMEGGSHVSLMGHWSRERSSHVQRP